MFNRQIIYHIYQSQVKLISFSPFLKIPSSTICSPRNQKPLELPELESFQSEKIVSLKNRRKSCAGKIAKTINRITYLIDKQAGFSSIDSCNRSLEDFIRNTRKLTCEITQSEQNYTVIQKELDICTTGI